MHFFYLAYYSAEKYGKGSGPVFMDFVNCTGWEGSFWDGCTHFAHYYGCSHDDDVGVQCQPGNGPSKPLIPMLCTSRNCLALCPDGQLRLAATYSGRVEICYNQRWNTLSSSDWSDGNAQITCIQLGFHYYLSAQFHV